jgi:hypothetical protein
MFLEERSQLPTKLKFELVAKNGAWKTFPLMPKDTSAVFIMH